MPPLSYSGKLYLGVDGGQSGTVALIADESGKVIGRGQAGACNHVSSAEGRTKFLHAVEHSIQEACREAGLDANAVSFSAACLGLSGGAHDKEPYARELIRSAKFKFTHDAEIALSGATGGDAGIIAIAGTGSIAFGRNEDGKTARAGGWGYVFGDEGGAFDLTRRALRAALQNEEGWGPQTSLRGLLLGATGAANANELLHRFYTSEYPRTVVASFAPLVSRAAEEGDTVARAIVKEAAAKLAWFVEGVYRSLFNSEATVQVAYVGGVFKSGVLLKEFEAQIEAAIRCRTQAPRFNPAGGAVLEALRLDGNGTRLSGVPESEK